jgi:hypothetical protein
MTPELTRTLAKLEGVINVAIPILERNKIRIEEKTQFRTPLVIAVISQSIEHHQSMLLLLQHDKTGSAFTLARSVFDGMYRGLWIDQIATDEEIKHFLRNDEIDARIGAMAEAIDAASSTSSSFQGLKQGSWSILCSFSHNGMQQLGRRFTGNVMEPSYPDSQKATVMELATVCILLLAKGFLEARGLTREVEEIAGLMLTLPIWQLCSIAEDGASWSVEQIDFLTPRATSKR